MELINYALAVFVLYLSPLLGAALAFIAPEELDPGKKYLIIMKRVVCIIIVAVILYGYSINVILIAAIALIIAGVSWLRYIESRFIYPFLAVVIYLSAASIEYFVVESALIFLYSLPAGTLTAEKLIKKKKMRVIRRLLIQNLPFLIIALLLFLIF